MKIVSLAVMAAFLTGCASLPSVDLSNRLSCTLDKKQAFINSMYGPLGVTSKVAAADGKALCAKE